MRDGKIWLAAQNKKLASLSCMLQYPPPIPPPPLCHDKRICYIFWTKLDLYVILVTALFKMAIMFAIGWFEKTKMISHFCIIIEMDKVIRQISLVPVFSLPSLGNKYAMALV